MGGRSSIHLAFTPASTGFDVTVDVAVRFDAVEELVQRENPRLGAAEKRATSTLGAELGNLRDERPLYWSVSIADPIAPTASLMVEAIREIGIPYLDRYEDPAEALSLLSDNGPHAWIHSPGPASRCMRAVALAVVLGHAGLRELIQSSEAFLASSRDPAVTRFREFVKALRGSA